MENPNLSGDEKSQTPQKTEGEPTPEKTSEPTAELPVEPEIDYKTKFSESTRENQRILKEKAELEAKLAEKASETSLETEIISKYPEWDMMTETEKILLKRQEETEKKLARLEEEKQWQEDLTKSIVKFPELSEQTEEFKEFCSQYPKGVDMETLAKSFLFDKRPAEEKLRKGLEKPSGGTKVPISDGWKSEDVARLRETDEKKYLELVRKGIIKGKDIK